MTGSERTRERYTYQQEPQPDGTLVSSAGEDRIPVRPPDWEEALGLLKHLNTLRDAAGRRNSSLVQIDGFEPWWFVQDRLYRFYLLPFTRYREFLQATFGRAALELAAAPGDLVRLVEILSGREGFPYYYPLDRNGIPLPSLARLGWRQRIGRVAPLALTWASLMFFRLLQRDTILYIIDQVSPGLDHDFRLSPLYQELHARGYRVAEYAHTLSPRKALANSARRCRPVAYIESFGGLSDLDRGPESPAMSAGVAANAADFEEAWERALLPLVLAWCTQSTARYRRICWAIRVQGAKRAIIFDDNRHNHELVAACRHMGVKVLGFQHGLFNRFHTGLMAYGFEGAGRHDFDLYGLWGPLFVERLTRDSQLFDPGRVFVSGPLRPPLSLDHLAPRADSGGGRVCHVLLVAEPLARREEVAAYLRPLMEDSHYHLQIKLRPGESRAGLKSYGMNPEGADLVQTASVYSAFENTDVVIGTYSSVLYEAVLALRPIVWLRTSMAYGGEVVQEGLAEAALGPEKVKEAVDLAARLPLEELKRRQRLAWGDPSPSGVKILLDRAEKDLWEPPGHGRMV